MWWIAAAFAGALGGSGAYTGCCEAMGTSCPAAVDVVGPGSAITGVSTGSAVKGLWKISCAEGAFFDPEAAQSAGFAVQPGRLLTQLEPAAAACFDAACQLPGPLCLRHETDGPRIQRCDGTPAAEADWRTSPRTTSVPVLLAGRVLRAEQRLAPAPSPARLAAPVGAPAPPRPVSGAPPAPTLEVPEAPPEPCIPDPSMRTASNAQVDEGNEAMLRAELGTSMDKYRAAISIMPCNAFAWAALGDTLMQLRYPARAQEALRVATRLMPSHYQAWTHLGLANEQLGYRDPAIQAYDRALTLRPGHPPAIQGRQRLGAP